MKLRKLLPTIVRLFLPMLALSAWTVEDLPKYERVSGVSGTLSSRRFRYPSESHDTVDRSI